MKKLTYKHNYEDGTISFFIDGVYFDNWVCDGGDPEMEFELFERIYTAGFNDGSSQ